MSDEQELQLLRQTFKEFIATSTELQQAYSQLKEESQTLSTYLASILENMEDAILVINTAQEIRLWNTPALGYLPALNNALPPIPLSRVEQDGLLELGSFLSGPQNSREISIQMAHGMRELTLSRRPFYSAQREILGQLLIVHDQTELKRLEKRSRQEDRLRVMGELAAEMAHEIRNPLGSIELMVSLLEQDIEIGSPNHPLIGRLRSAVQIMNHTVSNVLLYTREIQLKKSPIELGQLIRQAETAILAHIARQNLTISRTLPDISVTLDTELMQQALANLFLNAAQVSPQGGTISLKGALSATNNLMLTISDQGPGIPTSVQEKLFTPFFTTKTSGTGLGLAMVRRVLEAHHGSIMCLPVSHGASFLLQIPLE